MSDPDQPLREHARSATTGVSRAWKTRLLLAALVVAGVAVVAVAAGRSAGETVGISAFLLLLLTAGLPSLDREPPPKQEHMLDNPDRAEGKDGDAPRGPGFH